MTALEVLFSPAEFAVLPQRELSQTVCIVFDVLRATSSMVTALANGAAGIIPVADIDEALALRRHRPEVLLAGERAGLRIQVKGGSFDLGNSPREFTAARVRGRTIAMTTTNGTRALRSCARAKAVLLGSFLNLQATAQFLAQEPPAQLLLVCSGTLEETAYEDVLGAGALCELLWSGLGGGTVADSAHIARQLFKWEQKDLAVALARSRNGRRLLEQPALCEDVPFCLQRDTIELVGQLGKDGMVTKR